MLIETLLAMRDLPRLHEIASVLVRHGFGDLVRRTGLLGALERAGQALHRGTREPTAALTPAQRARLAMAELGPSFVKLGQLLATRVDLFPPDWIAEFEHLQSDVPPVPFETLLPAIEQALGRSPFEVFLELDRTALGAASIAQVHGATLQDGSAVVIKVVRPGIRPKIDADLRIVTYLAGLLESEIPEARRYQPVQMVAEFARSMRRELDLAQEARAQERFALNFADDPGVMVPRIYWDYTRESMNVQERVVGIPGQDLAAAEAAGLDRRVLARRGADAVLKMILLDGYFHADPHPGNVFYLPGNRIAMIDFGMAGRLSDQRRREIVDMLWGLARRDEQAVTDVLLDWVRDADVDEAKLAADVGDVIFEYEQVALKDVRIGALLNDITGIVRRHSIVLPSDLALLFKALLTLEGLGLRLDPEFRLVEHLGPFLRRVMRQRYRPQALMARGRRHLAEYLALIGGLPRDLRRLLKEARRGRMKLELDLKRLDHFGLQLSRSANRLTVGIVTAALIVGTAIVMTVTGGPTLFGLPLFGLLGFLLAFLGGVWVLVSIWRSGKD
jgi:ubiquinone biosynthesis protein